MVWSGMKTLEDNSTKISVPAKDVPLEEWQSLFTVKLKAFDKEYVMIEFDSEKVVKSGTTQTWLCACLNAQKRQALKKVI